jgi:imidazolonepropionase-like amidohydrolase
MVLHVRGIFLPDETERDAWIRDGLLTFERPPAGLAAETIAAGGWVIPGFVDAHCHIGISPDGFAPAPEEQAAQAILARDVGVLLVRDAGVPVDNRSVQARADLPRLVRAGRHIARSGRYIRSQGAEVEPADLVAEVERQVAAGDGWVKVVADWIDRSIGDLAPAFPDDVLARAIGRAHELGARVAAHVFSEAALPGLIAAGVDSIEHGTGLTDDLVEAARASGAAVVPTVINTDNFPTFARQGETKFPTYAAHMRKLFATSRDRVRTAWEAGIPIYVGSDAGAMPHGLLLHEVRALVAAGIPLPDVIAAASWAGREWLGFTGLVEGGTADLVVFDEDPRRSLGVIHHPRRMVLRGAVIA